MLHNPQLRKGFPEQSHVSKGTQMQAWECTALTCAADMDLHELRSHRAQHEGSEQ